MMLYAIAMGQITTGTQNNIVFFFWRAVINSHRKTCCTQCTIMRNKLVNRMTDSRGKVGITLSGTAAARSDQSVSN